MSHTEAQTVSFCPLKTHWFYFQTIENRGCSFKGILPALYEITSYICILFACICGHALCLLDMSVLVSPHPDSSLTSLVYSALAPPSRYFQAMWCLKCHFLLLLFDSKKAHTTFNFRTNLMYKYLKGLPFCFNIALKHIQCTVVYEHKRRLCPAAIRTNISRKSSCFWLLLSLIHCWIK